MQQKNIIRYEVNTRDEITSVNEVWDLFALANDSPGLVTEKILHRPLWQFITDQTVRHIYKQIFKQVRDGSEMSFVLRCDAPAVLRRITLIFSPKNDGSITINSQIILEEERSPLPLLDPKSMRSATLVRMCSWCQRINVGNGDWENIEKAVEQLQLFNAPEMPTISHGICATCYDETMAALA